MLLDLPIPRLKVVALGPLVICDDKAKISAKLTSTSQLLLIYLLTTAKPYTREMLAELFWPERHTKQSGSNLRTTLAELRKVCPDHLVITRTMVSVEPALIAYDVADFRAHIAAAQIAVQNARLVTAVPYWEAAIRLHQRPFLSGLREPSSPDLQLWLTLERELLYNQMLNALRQLVDYHLDQGNPTDAEPLAQRWLAFEPLNTAALQAVLHLLAEQGKAEAALSHYNAFRQGYRREHGALPENATIDALVNAITAGHYQNKSRSVAVDSKSYTRTRLMPAQAPASVHYPHPRPLVEIYGRTVTVERVVHKLRSLPERLVTLVGMGGVGKTVLAQHIGTRLHEAFQAGVCFVPLADLRPASDCETMQQQVALTIATALTLHVCDDHDLVPVLQAYLQPLDLLLILDNCEQLAGVAPLVRQLLQHAPMLRVLATSRVRLNLSGERVEPVTTLPLPPLPPDLRTMAENPAVQLFMTRAEQQLPTFALHAENMHAIHRICHVVGGLPLALEMAAYWITIYTPQEIAETIGNDVDFLAHQADDTPQRQRSIADLFAYSWQLLQPAEQQALAALSIFQSHFDRTTALTVAACTVYELAKLVNCALVEVKAPGVYALHPLIQTFAAARRPADAEIELRYIDYFFGQLASGLALTIGRGTTARIAPPAALSVHQAADLAYAWELAIARRCNDRLLAMLPHFVYFWRVIDRPRAGIRGLRLLQQQLDTEDRPAATQRLLGLTLHQTMRLAHIFLADRATALADGERALTLLTQWGKRIETGQLLLDLGNLYVDLARATEAIALLQQALTIAKYEEALPLWLGTTVVLSRIEWARGNWEAAAHYGQDALAAATAAIDPPPETTDLLWELFNQALLRREIAVAEAIYQRMCHWIAQRGADVNQRLQQVEMALSLALSQERWHDAHALAQAHWAAMAEQDNHRTACFALTTLATTTLQVDTAPNALVFAERALAMATTEGLTADIPHIHLILGSVRAALAQVDEARRDFLLVLDHALDHQGELYTLRYLFGGLFQLAQLDRSRLPHVLFTQVVTLCATQPQSGIMTRTAALRLATNEGMALAAAETAARQTVDWAALEALVRLVRSAVTANRLG